MKKLTIALGLFALISLNSCATAFGGKITECQKKKPENGSRSIRPVALVADILFPPALIVDFANGSIYKPCDKK